MTTEDTGGEEADDDDGSPSLGETTRHEGMMGLGTL